jgi:dTDP-4-amino-4,6-dideoxygalactose transaminase
VMVPSLTFTASAEILRYLGANPVFIDVDYGTGLVTPSIVKDAIKSNPGVKALILVHYGGQAPELVNDTQTGIIDLCRKNGIKVIHDAAHAFPTKHNNKFVGSFGDVSCFSFYANKTITTGEGGMLVTDDPEIHDRVKIMRLHGINHDIWDRFTANKPTWEYDVVAPGFKYNLADINAAIGLAQFEKAEYFRQRRQHCAEVYYENLGVVDTIDLPVYTRPAESHSWHLFPIKVHPGCPVTRNALIDKLADQGIGTSVHYKPLHQMTYYRNFYDLKPADYPETERIWKGTLSLPIYPDLKDSELLFICETIKKILG